jgi:hypothetical protein
VNGNPNPALGEMREKLRIREFFGLFRKMYLGTPVRALNFRLQSIRTRRGL